ncbi:MAG: hypothetical protein BGO01_03030 [Armatimonadetes bacterium 55-13]|nr:hypothetical protein [Armatimonadota bacterium]OJU63633.1 MAG: hypothetical protein BGO01_03030 [Armatimonadetes bacterium 55-13]
MSAGSYEHEITPIRGDVFLDRLFGWMTFVLAFVVLGAAVVRVTQPGNILWLEATRIVMILLGMIGAWLATRSTPHSFRAVLVVFAIRLIGCLALYPWSGGPRFVGSEFLFDVVVLIYAWVRIKALSNE